MTSKQTLIVDDEPDIRELLEITLGRMGIETRTAENLTDALQLVDTENFDLCLTDMHLPDGNGLQLVEHISANHPHLPVAMITAFGSMDTAIEALKKGAFDYVQKPVDLDQLRTLVDTALKIGQNDNASSQAGAGTLLGSTPAIENLRAQIAKLARSQAPIYVSGESGSGKEVAARLIHSLGPRAEGPFIAVNCGAIPSELMESEFFGHVKGSFTGAVSDKQGLFQAASGGTLFLDEVADLPLSMQVKLLRAIQEKAVRPVGSQGEDVTDIRVLSATHKDLAEEVDLANFRQDLYYRLNVIELRIPPLREHVEDVEELASASLARLARDYDTGAPALSPAATAALANYDFPGNIRELENILERAFTLCEAGQIEPEDLQLERTTVTAAPTIPVSTPASMPTGETSSVPATASGADMLPADTPVAETLSSVAQVAALPPGVSLEEYLETIERTLIVAALDDTRWNKTAAAKSLGITFRALRYKLKKLELE